MREGRILNNLLRLSIGLAETQYGRFQLDTGVRIVSTGSATLMSWQLTSSGQNREAGRGDGAGDWPANSSIGCALTLEFLEIPGPGLESTSIGV